MGLESIVRAAEWAFSHTIRPIDQFFLDLHARYAAGKEEEGVARYDLARRALAISVFSVGLAGSLSAVYSGEPLNAVAGLVGGGILFGLGTWLIEGYKYNVDRSADFFDAEAIDQNALSYKAAVKIGRLTLLLPQAVWNPTAWAVNDMASFLYSRNVADLAKFGFDLTIPCAFLGIASMCYFLDADPKAPRKALEKIKKLRSDIGQRVRSLLPAPPLPGHQPSLPVTYFHAESYAGFPAR